MRDIYKPFLNIRGWDLGLQGDITLAAEKKTGFSLLIGKFLKAAERGDGLWGWSRCGGRGKLRVGSWKLEVEG